MSEQVLVTGGGGFLGSAIVRQLLARGDTVRVLARGDYPVLRQWGAKTVQADLLDRDAVTRAVQGCEVVYHVAAQAGFWGRWRAFYLPNVVGTEHVLAACRREGVERVIFSSSPSVVFDGQPQCGINEQQATYPQHYESPYPLSKALAEQRVLGAADGTLHTLSLRPHLIFGPGDRHLLPRVVARARAGRLIQVGEGENRVDLCYVEDAARAHLLAADALHSHPDLSGRAYFITQGEPVVLWPWLNGLLHALGIAPVKRRLSRPAARRVGAGLAAVHRWLHLPGEPRLTPFLADELALDHYYDITAARRDLGYQPQHSMAEALEKTLDSFSSTS